MSTPGSASQKSSKREPGTAGGPVHLDGLDRVVRACREEPTSCRPPRAHQLVAADSGDHPTGRPAAVCPVVSPGRHRVRGRNIRTGTQYVLRGDHRTVPWSGGPMTGARRDRPLVALSNAWFIATLSSSNPNNDPPGPARTRYVPAGRDDTCSATMARNLRFSRFLTTALPTRLLTAYATCTPDQDGCFKKLTARGPQRPRVPFRRSSSNARRDLTAPTPVIVARWAGAAVALTPTADGVPSPGATG